MKKDYSDTSREWAYIEASKKPRIIVEKYLELASNEDLHDYKFFCFDGVPKYVQVISERYVSEKIDWFDIEWKSLKGYRGLNSKCENSVQPIPKPVNYQDMVNLAKKLSNGFPFVRVDLYNINGKIIFGELTFYPGSGYGTFVPDSFDFELGSLCPSLN